MLQGPFPDPFIGHPPWWALEKNFYLNPFHMQSMQSMWPPMSPFMWAPMPSTALPKEIEPGIFLVDDLATCAATVGSLMGETEVAVDVEGVDLCRTGLVCLIQVATYTGNTYLFDISTLGRNAFDQGRLRELLENDGIQKVLFDGRADSDALYHRHRVCIRPAYDLQIMHALLHSCSTDRYVKGLQKCLDDSGVVPPWESAYLHQLKEDGKSLFSPEVGGTYMVWSQRPLHTVLIRYAAADVRFLLAIKRVWGNPDLDNTVVSLAAARINCAISAPYPAQGPHMAERDFSLGSVPTFFGTWQGIAAGGGNGDDQDISDQSAQ